MFHDENLPAEYARPCAFFQTDPETSIFGRARCKISCSEIYFGFCIAEGKSIMWKLIAEHERTSPRVAPHHVPAKFLFPMRRKDHSSELASLDESEVLR